MILLLIYLFIMPTYELNLYGLTQTPSDADFNTQNWLLWTLTAPAATIFGESPPLTTYPTLTRSMPTGDVTLEILGPVAYTGRYTASGFFYNNSHSIAGPLYQHAMPVRITVPDWLIFPLVSGTTWTAPSNFFNIGIKWPAPTTVGYIDMNSLGGGITSLYDEPSWVVSGAEPTNFAIPHYAPTFDRTFTLDGQAIEAENRGTEFEANITITAPGSAPGIEYWHRLKETGIAVPVGGTNTWDYTGSGNPFTYDLFPGDYSYEGFYFQEDGVAFRPVPPSEFTVLGQFGLMTDPFQTLYSAVDTHEPGGFGVVYGIRVYKFMGGLTANREARYFLINYRNPSLWRDDSEQKWMGALSRVDGTWRVFRSQNDCRSFGDMGQIWPTGYKGGNEIGLHNNAAASVKIEAATGKVWFRWSSDGADWPDDATHGPFEVEPLEGSRQVVLRQKERANTVIISNGYDKTAQTQQISVADSWALV